MRRSRDNMKQEAEWAVERIGREMDRLASACAERDHALATITVNLRKGAPVEEVLKWWDEQQPKLSRIRAE